ncbi:hypothetical protein PIB30_032350 [Stylosanthes scabra]|uniref:Uncharacterized protein n=1 Tax=Stylosanthes scabra TaxID=79078 RepID=A0ABU6TBT4_9FABA|nr:hypothetical protein [Stylosanthes scabra]
MELIEIEVPMSLINLIVMVGPVWLGWLGMGRVQPNRTKYRFNRTWVELDRLVQLSHQWFGRTDRQLRNHTWDLFRIVVRMCFLFSLSYSDTMSPTLAGSSLPRPQCPSTSPTLSSSSFGASGGVSRERDRSLCAPRRVSTPSPQSAVSETSDSAGLAGSDISSVDAHQGLDRESISFDFGPSSHMSYDSGSSTCLMIVVLPFIILVRVLH